MRLRNTTGRDSRLRDENRDDKYPSAQKNGSNSGAGSAADSAQQSISTRDTPDHNEQLSQSQLAIHRQLNVHRDSPGHSNSNSQDQDTSRSDTDTKSPPEVEDQDFWVRLPYPLFSYTTSNTKHHTLDPSASADSSTQKPDTAQPDKYRSTRGWFDLSAGQMRQLTVDALDDAGNAMWKDARPNKLPVQTANPDLTNKNSQ